MMENNNNNVVDKTKSNFFETTKSNFFIDDAFVLFFAVVSVAVLMSMVLLLAIPQNDASDIMYWVREWTYLVALASTAILYIVFSKKNFFKATKLNVAPKPLDILLVALAMFFLMNGMVPVRSWIFDLLFKLGYAPPSTGASIDFILKKPIFYVLTYCILLPIIQQLIFSNIMGFGMLTGRRNKLFGIFLGGALFSLFAMHPVNMTTAFSMGAVLIFFASFGSGWIAIIGHISYNALALLCAFTLSQVGFYQNHAVLCAVVGLPLFALTICAKVFLSKKSKKTQQDTRYIFQEVKPISVVLLVVGVLVCLFFTFSNL